jgi:hypothetical protein
MARKNQAAMAADPAEKPANDTTTTAETEQAAQQQDPAPEAERVDPPADVEQQDDPLPPAASTDPAPEPQPAVPYVHQSGFRRVTNEEKQRTEVHVDIFIDAPDRVKMGTTVFPSDIWSNLIAAVGR